MIREIVPDVTFDLYNVNSRGGEPNYGLTQSTIERANLEADAIVVGGSNLYEGSLRWDWGVHLELDALKQLRVPLLLVGLGTGSHFLSAPHKPSNRAKKEIRLLNQMASFSGVRDLLTRDWLYSLGVQNAELMGDPATFIFNRAARVLDDGPITITMPPRRFWLTTRKVWSVLQRGRAMFRAVLSLARTLEMDGRDVVLVCNDPADRPLVQRLLGDELADKLICPQNPEDYFQILSRSRAVVTGRLHTAVVSFSLGIPFVLIDADQRSRGFIDTYQLDDWSANVSNRNFEAHLFERADRLLNDDIVKAWEVLVTRRDLMHARAIALLRDAFERIN